MLMKFNNSRAIIKHNTNTNVKQSVGGLLPMRLTRNTTQRLDQTDNNQIIRRLEKPTEKTMKWGEPIWFLFHTLAEKIKDEHFQAKKYELITLIRSICANLPCPMCTEHAVKYTSKLNIESIKSKMDWKKFLFAFHNEVNSRKNFPEFPYDELDAKYKSASTVRVINYFIHSYKEKSKSAHMISTEMGRMRTLKSGQQCLTNNLSYFDM